MFRPQRVDERRQTLQGKHDLLVARTVDNRRSGERQEVHLAEPLRPVQLHEELRRSPTNSRVRKSFPRSVQAPLLAGKDRDAFRNDARCNQLRLQGVQRHRCLRHVAKEQVNAKLRRSVLEQRPNAVPIHLRCVPFAAQVQMRSTQGAKRVECSIAEADVFGQDLQPELGQRPQV